MPDRHSPPLSPPLVPQPALESIAFQNVGCSVHGCAAVDELMRNTGSLRRLHLYNNMSGDEGAASIARLAAADHAVRHSSKQASAQNQGSQHPLLLQLLARHGRPRASVLPFGLGVRRLLSRCPAMEDFKMVSSRVGAEGGIALAKGLAAGVPALDGWLLLLPPLPPAAPCCCCCCCCCADCYLCHHTCGLLPFRSNACRYD